MIGGTSEVAPRTLDELVERLRARRVEAMSPSFSEIARRIGEERAARGVRARDRTPGRVTVYDCFRLGRRRIDVGLVLDIVTALGADRDETARWRAWCLDLQSWRERSGVVTVRMAAPPLAVPHAPRRIAQQVAAAGATVLVGMAGTGKTQIAATALAAFVESGTVNGIITVDVRGSDPTVPPAHARAILDGIARALGREADDLRPTADRAGAIARELDDQRIAVLLDDVGEADQVRDLARAISATPLVITSRRALRVGAHLRLDVVGWSVDEATDFLALRIGVDRVSEDPEAARAVAELTGGLPLAVSLTATRIAQQPDWSLRDHADALRVRLAGLQLDADVTASLLLSYQGLTEDQRRALRLCAAQPVEQLPRTQVPALLDVPAAAAQKALHALAQTHLVTLDDAGRVGMHALVRTFATAQSIQEDPPAQRDAAIDRLAADYIATARSAQAGAFADFTTHEAEPMEPTAAMAWYAAEVGHVIDVAHAVAARRPDLTVTLSEAIDHYVDSQTMFNGAASLFRTALECAHRLNDPGVIAEAEHRFGHLLLCSGDARAEAHLRRSIDLAQKANLPRTAIGAGNSLAMHAAYQGDAYGALAAFRTVREHIAAAGFEAARGAIADNIGVMLRYLGDLDGAIAEHRAAIAFAQEHGDVAREGGALSNLSEVYLAAGEIETAIATAEEAVATTRDVAAGRHAHALTNLGNALLAQGDAVAARCVHEEALAMTLDVSDASLTSYIHTNLGLCLRELDDDGGAREQFELARQIAAEANMRYELGRALVGLAGYDLAAGDTDGARLLLTDATDAFGTFGGAEPDRARELLAALPA